MAFMHDKQELKPGLVIFRRSDVKHRKWYCRMKLPQADRYKTISLETTDINDARNKAFDHDAELRFKVKHHMPVFDKTFAQVAKEYSDFQKQRADAGEITQKRWEVEDGYINKQLAPHLGPIQITLIGEEKWKGYPLWRRSSGKGRKADTVSDWTIRAEMATFRSVMLFAVHKHYIRENPRMFNARLKLGKPRGEAFTPEEYRKLYTHARDKWLQKAESKKARWYREIFHNFMLCMANTGLRPPEARNLRWRDVCEPRNGADGRQFLPIRVRGKGKFRELVAPMTVATYLERIRKISKATQSDDFVFTTYEGKQAQTLYASLLDDLLNEKIGKEQITLLRSASGKRRSIYSFRHTYATFRLMKGTDIYFLAKQMGTSVKMIEDYYGHITPSQNADAILQGIPGWEAVAEGSGETASGVNADAAGTKAKPRAKKREGKDLPAAGKASRSTRRR
ncbi:MAG: site-specific integrase [Alphaproteobacteria bacterium]|nr:MAG: site-specific integrase [Alphaproteobacteria bacterium]